MILPGPISWIKKTLAILKSNLSPNQIAFGFTLGVFAGLPPVGLHIILPCTAALLFRCSFRAFLASFALFKLLSLVIAPSAYAVGRWLLDAGRGLDPFWRFLFHLPVLAPMGYGRYLLLGSLVLSLLIGVPVFILVRFLVIRYRVSIAEWVSEWRISKWLTDRRGLGIVRWAFAGGTAKFETKKAPHGVLRFIRREALIVIPSAYAICYLLAALIVPFFAGTLMTSTASWVAGSEVSVSDSSFSLFTGRLNLTGFSLQDPDKPTENLLEIPSIRLDAGLVPLIAKRVVFDDVIISDVELHVVREEDGTLNLDNVSSGWNADGYIEWAARHAKDVDWLGLLRQLLRYLSDVRPLAPRDDPYGRFRGGRSLPDFRPPLTVKRLEVGRVLLSLEDRHESEGPLPEITLLEIEVSNLAFPALLRDRPVTVRLRGQFADDPGSGFSLSARFEAGEDAETTFAVSLTRIDLPRIARFYRTTLPVKLVSAKATATAELRLADGDATGNVSLLVEDLVIASRSGRPLFGLPPTTSERIVEGLNRYAAELPIVIGFPIGGTTAAPTWEWEAALLDVARDGLMMLGQRRLESTIEELGFRIDALGGVTTSIEPDYAALRAETEKRTGEILQSSTDGILERLLGSPPAEQTPSVQSNAAAPEIDEVLRRLLGGDND